MDSVSAHGGFGRIPFCLFPCLNVKKNVSFLESAILGIVTITNILSSILTGNAQFLDPVIKVTYQQFSKVFIFTLLYLHNASSIKWTEQRRGGNYGYTLSCKKNGFSLWPSSCAYGALLTKYVNLRICWALPSHMLKPHLRLYTAAGYLSSLFLK